MIKLEVPLLPPQPARFDPEYQRRHRYAEAAKSRLPFISSSPRVIGALDRQTEFSKEIDFDAVLHPHDEAASPEHRKGARKVIGLKLPFEVYYERGLAVYSLVDELEQFGEAISMAAAYEHSHYPQAAYADGSVMMSLEQSVVSPGLAQRGGIGGEIHRDGSPYQWHHLYMASDRNPTEFFTVGEPGIVRSGKAVSPTDLEAPFVPAAYDIAFANSTTLHRSPIIEEGGLRTFFRLSYQHEP
jgi:hypothetical protein